MKTFTIATIILVFSVVLFVELGWMTVIILPVFLFFVAASLIPMMVEGEDRSSNHHLATH